jgi:hypothetical protein
VIGRFRFAKSNDVTNAADGVENGKSDGKPAGATRQT